MADKKLEDGEKETGDEEKKTGSGKSWWKETLSCLLLVEDCLY